jgi:hypothetical protein
MSRGAGELPPMGNPARDTNRQMRWNGLTLPQVGITWLHPGDMDDRRRRISLREQLIRVEVVLTE